MSARINDQGIISLINSTANVNHSISTLLNELLEIHEKFKNPSLQSAYFRWGIESRKRRLQELKDRYNAYRQNFNSMSINDCLDEISEAKSLIHRSRNMRPYIIRAIFHGSKYSTIRIMKEYIHFKKQFDQLPELESILTFGIEFILHAKPSAE